MFAGGSLPANYRLSLTKDECPIGPIVFPVNSNFRRGCDIEHTRDSFSGIQIPLTKNIPRSSELLMLLREIWNPASRRCSHVC
jgi:hypothetical protein